MVAVYGLEPLEGETAFAFLVLRLHAAVDRDGLLDVLRFIAPLIPDADAFIEEFPDELEGALQMVGIPWSPPEAGHAVQAQRRLIEGGDEVGIEAAWFFQTGTSLPSEDDDEDDEDDDDDDDLEEDAQPAARASTSTGETRRASTSTGETRRAVTAVGDEPYDVTETHTIALELVDEPTEDEERRTTSSPNLGQTMRAGSIDDDGEDDDADDEPPELEDADGELELDDGDEGWSHGPPPQVTDVRFPVDGYPEILDELDWEDFGIAFKLAGPALSGENTVLLGFHTLWLAPYSDRYRNTAVTIDAKHHAAHLWVDRFAVPCSPAEQAHHLLWILSMIDRVLPVVHARFAPATMAQKYGGLVGEGADPFVLGGNPLLALYVGGGDAAVDAWLATQTTWSKEEVAQMLRELAIEIASDADDEDEIAASVAAALGDVTGVRDATPAREDDDDDDDADEGDEDDDDDEVDDDEDDEDGEDDDADEGDEDEDGRHIASRHAGSAHADDRGRHLASAAGAVLQARAAAGTLDPRAAERLLPVLERPEPDDARRRAVVDILGALRYRPAVPALIRVLGDAGSEELVAATAVALGAIADPAAIPALARIVTGGAAVRPAAAEALARCLEAAPEQRPGLDEAVLAALRFSRPTIPDDDQEIN